MPFSGKGWGTKHPLDPINNEPAPEAGPRPPFNAPLMNKIKWQWRRAFIEIPEVMIASIAGALAFSLYLYVWTHEDPAQYIKRYKMEPFVFRPDDPRLGSVRRFASSPTMTKTPTFKWTEFKEKPF